MSQGKIRSYSDFMTVLRTAGDAKAASTVPAVPEKDPQAKPAPSSPPDPSAAPAKQNTPESQSNSDTTTVLSPPAVAKTVEGEEKPANTLLGKAKAAANALKTLKTAAKGPGMTQVMPNMPPNTNTNPPGEKHTGDTGAKHPGKSGNPDPVVAKLAAPAGESKTGPADPALVKSVPDVKSDDVGPVPDSAKNTNNTTDSKVKIAGAPAPAATPAPTSGVDQTYIDGIAAGQVDPAFHLKLASVILKYEEGVKMAQDLMEREAGAEVAADLIKAASMMEEQFQALAAAEAEGEEAAREYLKQASNTEFAEVIKYASVHQAALAELPTEMEREAYKQGAMAAAGMGEAGMMGEQLPPEAPNPDDVSDGDIEQVLAAMVQSGQLPPELAEQILTALAGGGDPAAAGGGDPMAAAGGAMPPGGDPAAAAAAAGGIPPELLAAVAGGAGGPPPEAGGGEAPPAAPKKKEAPEPDADDKEAQLRKQASAAIDQMFKAAATTPAPTK